MLDQTRENERSLLACLYADGANIDRCLQSGLGDRHFTVPEYAEQFRLLCSMRGAGAAIDSATVYAEAYKLGRLKECGGVDELLAASALPDGGTSLGFSGYLQILLDAHTKREAYRVAQGLLAGLKAQSLSVEDIRGAGERIVECAAGVSASHRTTEEIAKEAEAEARAVIEGKPDLSHFVLTGFPRFDRYATPIRSHEFVLVAARTSHGKSSFLAQLANVNLKRGLRVVYFTLETSDKSVVQQIAAQRASCNVRFLHEEMPEHQKRYVQELNALSREKRLLVFDKDTSLTAIESRCRLLAQSFKPQLVVLDYIGLVGVEAGSAYERMSKVSKAMIPLTKALGCAVVAGAQLNRGPEKEKTQPTRSDLRDSGNLEEDAHRVLLLWRKPDQPLDSTHFDTELIQAKCRDAGLTGSLLKFNAAHTSFSEVVHGSTH